MERTDILIAGHCCHDTLVTRDGARHEALGGSPVYIGAVLGALGADFSVVSKVGEDFRYFDRFKRRPRTEKGSATTACVDDYSSGGRRETFTAVCSPIRPEDIDHAARIALGCGIAGELPPETLRRLGERSDILVCDVQGLVRSIGPDGRVSHRALDRTPFAELLPAMDFLKADEAEAESLDVAAARRLTTLLITREERGCTVVTADGELDVPGFPASVIDGTGAGDSFVAGFAFALLQSAPVEEAARFANYCGSLAVEHVGAPSLSRDDFSGYAGPVRVAPEG